MIVFNLACIQAHLFEGWFSSSEDFESQRARKLVACPVCGDTEIEKKLSAPRLNLGASAPLAPGGGLASTALPSEARPAQGRDMVRAEAGSREKQVLEQLQNMYMEMAKEVIANTEDVGPHFAEEARRIHYKEVPERNIRGQTTAEEAAALDEEGIAFASIALPAALKGPLQ